MNFRIDGNKLELGETSIALPFVIKKVIHEQDRFIVLVDDGLTHRYGDNSLDRNVYSFSESGDKLWQIQSLPFGDKKRPRPYSDLLVEKGKLVAYNWLGLYCLVNINSGAVTPYNTGQRPW